jgi:hypothetical protein
METPTVPINFVPAKAGETFKLGTITIRIMEDGSRTGVCVQSSPIESVLSGEEHVLTRIR